LEEVDPVTYVVKVGTEYLAAGRCPDIWTDKQSDAFRFYNWEQAFDCAEAWRNGQGARPAARIVRLVRK
jgi:hypothetical protein